MQESNKGVVKSGSLSEFLFAFLHIKPLLKRDLRKEFAPLRKNLFFVEKASFQKGDKKVGKSYLS